VSPPPRAGAIFRKGTLSGFDLRAATYKRHKMYNHVDLSLSAFIGSQLLRYAVKSQLSSLKVPFAIARLSERSQAMWFPTLTTVRNPEKSTR
jgi:hypothetical protein